MKATFDGTSAQIFGVLEAKEVKDFRSDFRLRDPLSFWHECVHWFQKKTLLGYSLNNLLLRAFASMNCERKALLFEKYTFCKRALEPFLEGTAIFAQYDYFPSNYFMSAGEHNYLDELFTLVVANRFSFQTGQYSEDELASLSLEFVKSFRISASSLKKKRGLLATPFSSRDKHQVGYLFIKSVVSHIKCYPLFHYVHDGAILSGLIYYVFEAPELIELVNDDHLSGAEFQANFTERFVSRLNGLSDRETVGEMFWRYSEAGGAHAAKYSLRIDETRYDDAEAVYSDLYKWVYDHSFPESVGAYMKPGETLDEYFERRDPEMPMPVDAFQVLHAMDAVKFGRVPATLEGEPENYTLRLDGMDEAIPLKSLGSNSMRAELYGWIKPPPLDRAVCLKEILFFFDHRLFHVTTVDFPHGTTWLTHDTADYNMGYPQVGAYLQSSFEIDTILDACREEARRHAVAWEPPKDTLQHIADTYFAPSQDIQDSIGKRHNARPLDLFTSDREANAFLAYSLIQPILSHADEYERTVHNRVDTLISNFLPIELDPSKVKSFTRKGAPFSFSKKIRGRKAWFASGTYL